MNVFLTIADLWLRKEGVAFILLICARRVKSSNLLVKGMDNEKLFVWFMQSKNVAL